MKKYFMFLSLLSTVCLFSQSKTDTIQPILQPIKFDVNLNTNKHFFTFNNYNHYNESQQISYDRGFARHAFHGRYEGKGTSECPVVLRFRFGQRVCHPHA